MNANASLNKALSGAVKGAAVGGVGKAAPRKAMRDLGKMKAGKPVGMGAALAKRCK